MGFYVRFGDSQKLIWSSDSGDWYLGEVRIGASLCYKNVAHIQAEGIFDAVGTVSVQDLL